ncbi:MAG: GerW family sporulation protein [Lachnospiraceae bacterium]|nr:GerW family sporulation protein [Lachnospiraceae bacterium]MDY5700646.1 GerW family sporulation protein [Lachnospiraceae bacterium]
MTDNNFSSVMTSLLKGVDSVLSTKTVVGEAITIGDTIILPLVDVSFGIGAGAGVQDKKSSGTGGVGGKMTPSAVLVIKDGHTKLVNIKQQDTMTKILDMIPDVVDRFTAKKDTDDLLSDAEAKEAAFPKENTKNSDICDKSTE